MKKYINNFDESYMPLFSREFIPFIPEWRFKPELGNYTWEQVKVNVGLSTIGFVYGIAIKNGTDRPVKPTAAQIMSGLNTRNLPYNLSKMSVEVENLNANYTMIFSNLDQNSTYYIYLIAGSTHPNNPDMMKYDDIANISVSTLLKPIGNLFYKFNFFFLLTLWIINKFF